MQRTRTALFILLTTTACYGIRDLGAGDTDESDSASTGEGESQAGDAADAADSEVGDGDGGDGDGGDGDGGDGDGRDGDGGDGDGGDGDGDGGDGDGDGDSASCEECLAQAQADAAQCELDCSNGAECTTGACLAACASAHAASEVACTMQHECPAGTAVGDVPCIFGVEDCTVCEDLIAPCFSADDCDAQWCEDWLTLCSVDFCEMEQFDFEYQGTCTISHWGIGKLLTLVDSYIWITGGDFVSKLDTCDDAASGIAALSDDELMFCGDSCADLAQAGGGTLTALGWCE